MGTIEAHLFEVDFWTAVDGVRVIIGLNFRLACHREWLRSVVTRFIVRVFEPIKERYH